jgi:hypothetical protein
MESSIQNVIKRMFERQRLDRFSGRSYNIEPFVPLRKMDLCCRLTEISVTDRTYKFPAASLNNSGARAVE